jgi:hypothetical protein
MSRVQITLRRVIILSHAGKQWRTQKNIFFGYATAGGVQQIQLRTEGRENGDLGAVAP